MSPLHLLSLFFLRHPATTKFSSNVTPYTKLRFSGIHCSAMNIPEDNMKEENNKNLETVISQSTTKSKEKSNFDELGDFLLPGDPVFSDDEFFGIQSLFSGLCLRMEAAVNYKENKLCLYTPSLLSDQKWMLDSKKYLRIFGTDRFIALNGDQVVISDDYFENYQDTCWVLTENNELMNEKNKLVLTALKGSYESAQVMMRPPDGSLAQKWKFQPSMKEVKQVAKRLKNMCYIKDAHDDKVLDANEFRKPEKGSKISISLKNGFASQQWLLSDDGYLQSFFSDLVLTAVVDDDKYDVCNDDDDDDDDDDDYLNDDDDDDDDEQYEHQTSKELKKLRLFEKSGKKEQKWTVNESGFLKNEFVDLGKVYLEPI